VRILLDENISRRLVSRLQTRFEAVEHVASLGLTQASDETIWEYAKEHSLIIVSKDSDFHQRSFVRGHPPKVVWLRVGNCTTERVAEAILLAADSIQKFAADEQAAFLIVP